MKGGFQLTAAQSLLRRAEQIPARRDLETGHLYPTRQEKFLFYFFGEERCMNAAAGRVPHNDQMVYVEVFHTVFHSGHDCVTLRRKSDGRDECGNASHHKEIAGFAAQKNSGIYTRVTAGNDKTFGFLPVSQLIKKFLFLQEIGLLKVMKTCDEFVEAAHDGLKR